MSGGVFSNRWGGKSLNLVIGGGVLFCVIIV
jgi:hypothetical protein